MKLTHKMARQDVHQVLKQFIDVTRVLLALTVPADCAC